MSGLSEEQFSTKAKIANKYEKTRFINPLIHQSIIKVLPTPTITHWRSLSLREDQLK
jgi:hypothetical protein